jgi:hypothetical protein
VLSSVLGGSLQPPTVMAQTRPTSSFRVGISNQYVRQAVNEVLAGASEWLQRERCQALFSEFRDGRGLPLADRLRELNAEPQSYLRTVLFVDAEREGICARDRVLAFTAPGSRIVYLCGPQFERMFRRNASGAQATVIHEILHTLGLGENPPTPRHINARVEELCWH